MDYYDGNNEKLKLSAGICDTCAIPNMVNQGDGINEPIDPIYWCEKMEIEVQPLPLDVRITYCKFFTSE